MLCLADVGRAGGQSAGPSQGLAGRLRQVVEEAREQRRKFTLAGTDRLLSAHQSVIEHEGPVPRGPLSSMPRDGRGTHLVAQACKLIVGID